MAAVGVPPPIMGIGPEPVTRKLLARTGLDVANIDVMELNGHLPPNRWTVRRRLGLPDGPEYANPKGGAIALGHPLGISGARLVLSAAIELSDRGVELAVATMCICVGQGIALRLQSA
jgi:acetyl-CoA acetyltransferase